MSSAKAGMLAYYAADRKQETYRDLIPLYSFKPIAFESKGVFGQDALAFTYDVMKWSRLITNEPLSSSQDLPMYQCTYSEL